MPKGIAQKFTPPNPLRKARNGPGPVRIDPEALERAEKAVESLNEEYADWAQQDIGALRGAIAAARRNPNDLRGAIGEIYTRALDLKGQGGGFGYDLITSVGDLLTKFMEGRTAISPRDFEIIQAHADAMHAVIRDGIKGDGGEVGVEIVAGLRKLVQQG